MNRVEVDLTKEVSEMFPKILIKDLTENERICPVCHGLGMKIENNVYGLQGDMSEIAKRSMFPYKHQALSFCQSCYNGVQRSCKYCGKPYKNQSYLHCDCEGQNKVDEEKRIKAWNEKVANAKEVQESDVNTMLYCEEEDAYYDCVDDFFESYANNKDFFDGDKPNELWVCGIEEIYIDASNVIEDACSDLHEDANDNCDYKSLQTLLDSWCKDQTGTTTYYPCYKEYVKIDWSKY